MTDDDDEDEEDRGPTYKEITDDRVSADVDGVEVEDFEEDNTIDDPEPELPIESDLRANEQRTGTRVPEPQADWVRRSVRLVREIGLVVKTGLTKKRSTACRLAGDKPVLVESLFKRLSEQDCDSARRAIRRELERRSQYHDVQFAFKMSVKAAMRDRPKEALLVIEAELRQMHDKTVWHGMANTLAVAAVGAERSSYMALSCWSLPATSLALNFSNAPDAKYLSFKNIDDRMIARRCVLVRSRRCTGCTSSARETRSGGSRYWGCIPKRKHGRGRVIVHMRLDKVMTDILVKIDPQFEKFVAEDGSSVVQLDKALYGCVEAAHLWYLMLREKLEAYGFEANPAEPCVFNKLNSRYH